MGKNIDNTYSTDAVSNNADDILDAMKGLVEKVNELTTLNEFSDKRNICNEEFLKMISSGNIYEHEKEDYDDKYETEVVVGTSSVDENNCMYTPVTIKVYKKGDTTPYETTQNIYKIPKVRNKILLTNDYYTMRQVYPETYETMTKLPDGVGIFNTKYLTTMEGMFYGWNGTSIDLSDLDTRNITNMHWMFCSCEKLTTLNLNNFNTSNVINMEDMFGICESLTTLNISNWDTSKVTNMSWMFDDCISLTTLDVSKWNTSNVTNMNFMFMNCESLTTLNVYKWNTSNVTSMRCMFDGCKSLTTLDVYNWNTSNATDMRCMFDGCKSLTTLDVSNFNTSKVTDMRQMFEDCNKLTTLDVSKLNTSKVTTMNYMFNGCKSLTSLNLNNFKVNANTDISGIIAGCTSLTPSTLKMDSFKNIKFKNASGLCAGFNSQEMIDYICSIIDLSENTDFGDMFANIGIKNLVIPKIKIKNGAKINSILGNDNLGSETQKINVDASNVDISDISDVSYIFAWSERVESLDVSKWDTSNVVNMEGMFYNCDSLTTLNISNWDTSNVTNMNGMFNGCESLTTLNISNWDTSNVTNMSYMFGTCTNLTTIVGIIDMKSCEYSYNNMFYNCNKLTGIKLKNVPSGFNASKAGLKESQYTIVS